MITRRLFLKELGITRKGESDRLVKVNKQKEGKSQAVKYKSVRSEGVVQE